MAGIERRHWLSAVASTVLAAGAWAGGPLTPTWTYSSGSQSWIPRNVALGDKGSQVLTQIGSGYNSTKLLSSYDWDPPSPVWETVEGQQTYGQRASSADAKDVHVTLHDIASSLPNQRNLVLRRYRSTSSAPQWSWTFPVTTNGHDSFDVAVAEDGTRVVAITFNIWNGKTDVAVFDSESPTPLFYGSINTSGVPRHLRLSSDGSKIYVASDARIIVMDSATGALDDSRLVFDTMYAGHALAGDGQSYAYGTTGATKLFRRGSAGYELALVRSLGAGWISRGVDLSDDGTVLAAAYVDVPGLRTVRVETIDVPASLAQGSAVVLASHDVTGAGSLANDVTKLELSADGTRLAVGLWGDELGHAPEVLVFDTTLSQPIATYDLPGSVFDLDLAGDGKALAVSSKAVHNSTGGSGGRIDLFDLSTGDFVLRGKPRQGQTVRVELEGAAGSEAFLLWSDTPALRGISYAGVGTLHLDRVTLTDVSMGYVDANGHAAADFVVPASVPVGRTLYMQGLTLNPRVLTDTWLEVTVLP